MSKTHQRYHIDKILPAEEFHIIGGPSGSGKTRFAFQLIQSWAKGEPFHGHTCTPAPFAYVSCDRSLDSVKRTLDDLSIPHDAFPMFSDVDDKLNNLNSIIAKVRGAYPKTEVLFLDGVISLLPGGKVNDYSAVSNWLKDLNRLCKSLHITLIGLVHTAKTKEGESYLNPREQIMGSVAFAGFSDCIIMLRPVDVAEVSSKRRMLCILPRTGASEYHEYEFNSKGEIHPVPPGPPRDPSLLLRVFVSRIPKGTVFTYEEVAGLGGLSRSQVHRILGDLSRRKEIERIGKGEYVALKESTEADIFPPV